MSKEQVELAQKYLKKYVETPTFIRAIQFDNSPENLELLTKLANGKLEVDNTRVDKPILHIEMNHLALALQLGDWLICKDLEQEKWTTASETNFIKWYEIVADRWKKFPENKPEEHTSKIMTVFATVNKGTPFEARMQIKVFWNGELFWDVLTREETMDSIITHFYEDPIIDDPE